MIEIIPIHTTHPRYSFVEALLHAAFPEEERRNDAQQRLFTNHHPKFHCCLLTDNRSPVGLLNYWDFKDFLYIEHFAIHESMRNNGYGGQALRAFLSQTDRPVVLEVELPRVKGDLTHRRIAFYRRHGFSLRKISYRQPPYRKGDEWLPMKLMSSGIEKWWRIADRVRDVLYREVYGVKE